MRFLLTVQGDQTGTLTSDTLDLSGYAPLSGNAMELTLEVNHTPTTAAWGNFTIASEADNASPWTWTPRWTGDVTTEAGKSKVIYTCDQYLRLTADYTAPTDSPDDPGGRLTVRGRIWGPPDWNRVVPCREEHLLGLRSRVLDTTKGFPARWEREEAAAKKHLESSLRGLGLDPFRLLTDGHLTYPCIEGLEHAGAALTMFYILLSSQNVASDFRREEMERFYAMYENLLKTATSGGLLAVDEDASGGPGDEEAVKVSRVIL